MGRSELVVKRSLWTLSLLLFIAVAVSLFLGPVKATPDILWSIRVPRVCLGILVGMALATAGTIFQGLLQNPLADPYVLGTSSGASLGVLVAALLPWHSPVLLYGLSFGFALASIIVVYQIAETHGKTPVQTLILAGVVVSTFLNALVFLGFSLFSKQFFTHFFLLLGTLTEGEPALLKISGFLIVCSSIGAWFFARDLNLLSQGEETAQSLGIDPEKSKRLLFAMASLLIACAVTTSGMIGFVGLIVPHMMRLIVGPDHRRLVPASAIGGAIILILMDAFARAVAAPLEIPVGVVSALCGAPFFIYLLKKKKGEVF